MRVLEKIFNQVIVNNIQFFFLSRAHLRCIQNEFNINQNGNMLKISTEIQKVYFWTVTILKYRNFGKFKLADYHYGSEREIS